MNSPSPELVSELLLLPDGRILVHPLTRPMAGILQTFTNGELPRHADGAVPRVEENASAPPASSATPPNATP